MKIEVDFSQTIKALEDVRVALQKTTNAWTESLRELRKLFKEIRIEESNNYLKYHKNQWREEDGINKKRKLATTVAA